MEFTKYIPISECKDRHLYIIDARNADIGVYIASEKVFKISRYKGSENFIDVEYHWNIEPMEFLPPPFLKLKGTVKPLTKLNYIGAIADDDEKLQETLNNYMKELFYDIKQIKKVITVPITLIDSDRMKRLRSFRGTKQSTLLSKLR